MQHVSAMATTIASVLSFVPLNIWRILKKFVTKDGIIVFDVPFKLSTKYTPALLIIMMCLSFANQFVRNIEIDCTSGDSFGGGGGGRGGSAGQSDPDLNTFCWNYETFLVERALTPEMRGRVTYPGVSGYDKGMDEIVRQRYYKYVWLAIGKLAVLTFLPLFLWKFRGSAKIRSLVEVMPQPPSEEEDVRVSYFIETIGFNAGFALHYLACKFLAALTPIVGWYYLCGFLGGRYKYYGWDVMKTFMDTSDPWPNPMDALFPKMAKCEWSKYGISGDREIRSAQCQLPMNNLTQWSFFIFWWWLALVFILNLLSTLRLFLLMFPPYRTYRYRVFVAIMCRDDIDMVLANSNLTGKRTHQSLLKIDLNFGEWLVLNFLKKNLKEWQFRAFIRRLAITKNGVIQIKPPTKNISTGGYTNGGGPPKSGNYYQNIQNANGGGGGGGGGSPDPSATTIQIGFRDSLLDGIQPTSNGVPPAYNLKCEPPETNEFDMRALLESQRENSLQLQSTSRSPNSSAESSMNEQHGHGGGGHHQQHPSPYQMAQMGFQIPPMANSTPVKKGRGDKKNPLASLAQFVQR